MVRIGDVWDSTTDVLAGRAGLLAPLAIFAFVLLPTAQNAIKLYSTPTPGIAALAMLVALAGLLASLWGQLAIIAVASDPATTRDEAGRLALGRLPASLLVLVVLAGVAMLLMLPVLVTLIATHYNFAAAAAYRGAGPLPTPSSGAAALLALYFLLLGVFGLWLGARLFLVNAVILNERRAIGAFARSFALTRGLTLKLIGVALLFGIVFLVAVTAAQSVVGLVARLVLGPQNIATSLLLAAIAAALVTAALTTIVQVFAARLYASVTARGSGTDLV